MKRKGKKRYVFLYIQAGILSFVGLFIIIGLMTTFLSIRISADFMNTALKETDSQKVFRYFLASENKYFAANQNPLEDISITKLAFQLMTNVKPDDYRTFLGKEIPGFSEFDTKIEVAGQGTDFTTLPEESSPPMEVLLKEKEISQEMLTEDSKENKDSNPKPSQTTNGRKVVYLYHTHSWESFLPLLKNAI
ncbi:stage II sporulation protein P [Bacillus licheniformis]|uniref:stage II sporulation protein P n=1 Tax=Bacillus licheniformis TaxID=1402 RepID=UPI002DBBB306|nr:stage II sporulation protein P [Bacillus licheniformis]MEC0488511.1 stage II sporulation protein P [Bacillus licheniformis]